VDLILGQISLQKEDVKDMTGMESVEQGIISVWGVNPDAADKFMANNGHGSLNVEEGTGVAIFGAVPFANALGLPTTNRDTIESLPLAMDGIMVCTQAERGMGKDGGSPLHVTYYPTNSGTFEGTHPALARKVVSLAGTLGVKIVASMDTIAGTNKVAY
jgi:hypothetical protein